MKEKQLSHDILNLLEKLRIMHDLIKDKNYSVISKQEITIDLDEAFKQLHEKFEDLLQR